MTMPVPRTWIPLVSLILLIACGTESGQLPTGPRALASVDAAHDAPHYSDWSAPVHLGPIVNSSATDLEVFVSRNGRSLYIASSRSGNFDIWVSQRASTTDPWGPAQPLGPAVNSASREQSPFLSPDEHRLYFFSDRDGGFGGTDLYMTRRRDRHDDFGWETPVNLGSAVNTAVNETLPVLFDDDRTGTITLYFNRLTDIFVSMLQPDGTFDVATEVSELNSPRRDRILSIRRDGLELFLASDRPGPVPAPFDLWVATRASTSDRWSPPVNLGQVVNSGDDEGGAALSFDGTALYFTSSRPSGVGGHDLWLTTRSRLRAHEP